MKKLRNSSIITTLLLIISLFFIHNSSLRLFNTVFVMNDAKNDDYGAGNVKYPLNMKNKQGLFDLTKFSVKKTNKEISFEYILGDINNEFENKNGFSNVLIDTYISTGEDGLLTTLEYGASITFNEDYPWVYHIRITPEESYIEKLTDKVNRETEVIESKLEVVENKIKLIVNKDEIKENLKESKYYVFTGGYDIFGSDNYRRIIDEEDEWDFYGGIKSLYQPNILDVVSPIQERMLSYFVPPVYAVLSPIYNQAHQLVFKKELVYLMTFAFFGYEYFSLYKRYKKESNINKENKKDA